MAFAERAVAYLKGKLPAVTRDFVGDLIVTYVVDVGDHYQFVQDRDVDSDGLSSEDLHRLGLRNLLTVVEQRNLRVQPYGSIFAVLMGGDFEASLVLLDTVWDHSFRQFVSGDFVVAAPARDVVAFCDSASSAGIEELRQLIARTCTSGDHLLSNRLYVRRAAVWEPALDS